MIGQPKLSKEQARSFLINYHNLNWAEDFSGTDGVMKCFDRLNSIQFDPLDVVSRNAELVLQARIRDYRQEFLYDLLYKQHVLYDGVDKEMCIYRSSEFPYFQRVRMAVRQSVMRTLSYRGQTDVLDILDEVRAFIRENGATGSKDLSIGESRESRWGHKKLSSAALDYLYNIGELSLRYKKNVNKFYDFTENILPAELLARKDDRSQDEYIDWYVKRRIRSIGLLWSKRGGGWQGQFLSDRETREASLKRLEETGEIIRTEIEGIKEPFFMAAEDQRFLAEKKAEKRACFLAPLDNLLWDREMVSRVFDFDYRWEVYTPVVKRKYGYYVLPVLYGNQLVARFEPEIYRKGDTFTIKSWWWEDGIDKTKDMEEKVEAAKLQFGDYLAKSEQAGI